MDDVNTTYAKAQKSLDDTIKNMETFNNVILNTDTFDLIDMQDGQLKTLSSYSRTSYTNQTARNYYKKTQFRNSVSEINTALHSNSQNVKYQNALAKQLAESKYSGKVTANEDLIDSVLNSYKNITKNDLYKEVKSYKKHLKSILPALYAAYRFSRDKRGNTIILKEATKFGKLLDEYFKLGKSLNKSNKYKNGELTKTFKSLMEKLGKTRYNEELSKVFKSFTDTTKMRHKFAKVTKSIAKTSGSLFKEGFIKEVTFNRAGKALWNASKAGGVKGLVQSAKEGLRNYKEGFKTASKFGKFLKGAAVVGVALDVVDTFSKIHDNSQNAKRQGLRGNEVKASVATGFVIDAAKAAGTTVAATAAASAGAAGVGAVVTGVAAVFGAAVTAPAWLTGAAAIGTAALVGWGLSELDKRFKITDNLKKGANSLIKGMRGWFK